MAGVVVPVVAPHLTRIVNHRANIRRRRAVLVRLGKAANDSSMKELDGEEVAADFMEGTLTVPPIPGGAPAPPVLVGSQMSPGTYGMLKGFTSPGPGIDQIWVSPPNWSPPGPPPLAEIVIVEAKGGNGVLDTQPRYEAEFGTDFGVLNAGCKQLDPDWVFILGCKLANAAEDSPGLREVGQWIRHCLYNGPPALAGSAAAPAGGAPPPIIRGVAIQEVQALIGGGALHAGLLAPAIAAGAAGLPLPPAIAAALGGAAPLPNRPAPPPVPAGPAAGSRKRQRALPTIQEIQQLLSNPEVGNVFADCQTARAVIARRPGAGGGAQPAPNPLDPVLNLHFDSLARRSALLERLAEGAAQRLHLEGGHEQTQRTIRLILKEVKKCLSEIKGEGLAADFMASHRTGGVNDYRMISGMTAAHTGIDQVWVRPSNWTLGAMVPPLEIVIVECKGNSAALGAAGVYLSELDMNGVPMVAGCRQMDPNWVHLHSTLLVNGANSSEELRAVGDYIRRGLAPPPAGRPPHLVGAVLRDGVLKVPATLGPNVAGFVDYN